MIVGLARLSSLDLLDGEVPSGAVQDVIDEATIILPIAGVIDLESEKVRLEREIARQDNEIDRFEKRLGNEKFIANAPDEVVIAEREKLDEARQTRIKLGEARERVLAAS